MALRWSTDEKRIENFRKLSEGKDSFDRARCNELMRAFMFDDGPGVASFFDA